MRRETLDDSVGDLDNRALVSDLSILEFGALRPCKSLLGSSRHSLQTQGASTSLVTQHCALPSPSVRL
jgi:hypothetical protein